MAEKKPIVGIDLGIDPEYIEECVRQTVCAGIAEVMGNGNAVASSIVSAVLEARVDSDGRVITEGGYRYDRATPIIEHYVQKVVRKEAASYVAEMLEQYRPQIRDAIAKQLGRRQFANDLAEKFMAALVDTTTSNWKYNVDVSFEKPKERY